MQSSDLEIRNEMPSDQEEVSAFLLNVYPTSKEMHLVEELRRHGHLPVSLVALVDKKIVGYIAFSPMSQGPDQAPTKAAALNPWIVDPEYRELGIGHRLLEAGQAELRKKDFNCVFGWGDDQIYSRSGFATAEDFEIHNSGVDHSPRFYVRQLQGGAVESLHKKLEYSPEFKALVDRPA